MLPEMPEQKMECRTHYLRICRESGISGQNGETMISVRLGDLTPAATAAHGNIEIAKLPAGLLTESLWQKIWDAYNIKGSCLTIEETIAIYETEEEPCA
jgi:hypothetical protein